MEPGVCGILEFEFDGTSTRAIQLFAKYPLKLLQPKAQLTPEFDGIGIFMLGYGGGFVSGDKMLIDCKLGPKTKVVLLTQSSTKVYKSFQEEQTGSLQVLRVDLRANTLFAHLPDPVTCFARSNFSQKQLFQMDSHASLILVDWLSAGRKRLRRGLGAREEKESWLFDMYKSDIEIVVEGEPILVDRLELTDNEEFSLAERMGRFHVFGTVIVLGKQVQEFIQSLLARGKRKPLREEAQPVPTGSIACLEEMVFREISYSISPVWQNQGVVLRFASEDTETAYAMLQRLLAPLSEVVGHKPYSKVY